MVVGAVILCACGRNAAGPEGASHPQLTLRVPTDVLQDVAKVTVTVTGPGMQQMSATWNVQSGQHSVSGTLTVPPGEDRVFAAAAKDAADNVLAYGTSEPIDLAAGQTRTVTIELQTELYLFYDDGDPAGSRSVDQAGDPDGLGCDFDATGAWLVDAVEIHMSEADTFMLGISDQVPPNGDYLLRVPAVPSSIGWNTWDLSGYAVTVSDGFFVSFEWDYEYGGAGLGWDAQDCGHAWELPLGAVQWQHASGTPFLRVRLTWSGQPAAPRAAEVAVPSVVHGEPLPGLRRRDCR
jgi:hypothetical protein